MTFATSAVYGANILVRGPGSTRKMSKLSGNDPWAQRLSEYRPIMSSPAINPHINIAQPLISQRGGGNFPTVAERLEEYAPDCEKYSPPIEAYQKRREEVMQYISNNRGIEGQADFLAEVKRHMSLFDYENICYWFVHHIIQRQYEKKKRHLCQKDPKHRRKRSSIFELDDESSSGERSESSHRRGLPIHEHLGVLQRRKWLDRSQDSDAEFTGCKMSANKRATNGDSIWAVPGKSGKLPQYSPNLGSAVLHRGGGGIPFYSESPAAMREFQYSSPLKYSGQKFVNSSNLPSFHPLGFRETHQEIASEPFVGRSSAVSRPRKGQIILSEDDTDSIGASVTSNNLALCHENVQQQAVSANEGPSVGNHETLGAQESIETFIERVLDVSSVTNQPNAKMKETICNDGHNQWDSLLPAKYQDAFDQIMEEMDRRVEYDSKSNEGGDVSARYDAAMRHIRANYVIDLIRRRIARDRCAQVEQPGEGELSTSRTENEEKEKEKAIFEEIFLQCSDVGSPTTVEISVNGSDSGS
jgi:hypothetical protein